MGLRWPGVQSVLTIALLLVLTGLAAACGQSTPAASTSPGPLVASASAQPLAGFDLWAAGTSIYASRDGGVTWRAMRTPHDLFWNIAASDARHAWVARPTGEILATRDGGATWTVRQPPDRNRGQLGAVACSDARHIVVTGWAPGGVFVLATADGGRHWRSSRLLKTPHDLDGIASPDAQHIWAVGSPGLPSEAPGGIIASRDGGSTWTVQKSDRDVSYRGVAFSDARSGWAVGYSNATGRGGVIAHTTDGGATWTQLRLSGVDSLQSVTCSDAQHAWAVGDAFDGSSAAIAATRDGGRTWSVRTLRLAAGDPQRLFLMAVTCSDASHLWVVGTTQHAGVVLASSDGGATWTVQSMRPEMAGLRAVTSAQGH
jgi:photosystem II stability/assembly factor-like uncharacterized protein